MTFSFSALLVDAALLQQSYRYFGGGSLNKALALSQFGQYLGFLAAALAYNLLFGATTGLLALRVLARFTKMAAPARVVLVFLTLVCLDTLAVVLRYNLYEYFKDTFSFGTLRLLAGGDLRNIFSWISLTVVVKSTVVVATMLILLLLISRFRWPGTFEDWHIGRRSVAALALAWGILIAADFRIAAHNELRYGLSQTASYAAIDSALAVLTDIDRDGYGPLSQPRDPDNFNASISPYAVDRPGDGIDQDGLCGDLPALDPAVPTSTLRALVKPNHKNLIVVVVETFRTDVVGRSLGGREVMPFLNSLGRRFAATTSVYSNFGVTSRAIETVFAGNLHWGLGDPLLLDYLRSYGYRTYAVSGQEESWGGTDKILGFGRLDRAYDSHNKNWNSGNLSRYQRLHHALPTLDSTEVNPVVEQMLDQAGGSPFAMYVNYQDLHYPYYSPAMERVFTLQPRTNSEFFAAPNREAILAQYANAAHHLDSGIAGLFAALQHRGMEENTVVVIVGDHPDSIYENGILGHAWTLDEHQRRTPLVVVNGRGEYKLPLGQDEIAGMILNSLDDGPQLPPLRFVDDPRKRIFELAGTLDAPREIGWIRPGSLASVDLMRGYYRPEDGSRWIPLGDLRPGDPDYNATKELVNRWETEKYLQWKAHPE